MPKPLRFKATKNREFSTTLKKRVRNYFKENNISTHANARMIIRTIALAAVWAGSWGLIVFGGLPLAVTYLLWAVLGVSIALVAINVGHDAIHGAYSGKKWVNDLLSHSFNLNGASAYMWKNMHNIAHHTYTNVHGYDEDISPAPILRVSPEAELKKVHKNQYWYCFFVYTLATLSWIFMKDYVKFFKNEVGNFNERKHPAREYFYLFFYKILNYSLFLVIPLLLMPLPWYHILGGFFVMHFFAGFYLALIFMLAHAVEDVHFPKPEPTGSLENDWFVHQMYTTANFCAGSRLAAFLSGGLNQQVEHHLFPNICSVHYPELKKIVKGTAEEFNIPYYDKPTFFEAIKSHVKFLKKMGRVKDYTPEPVQEDITAEKEVKVA